MKDFSSFLVTHHTTNIHGANIHLFHKKGAPIYIRMIIRAGSRHDKKEGTGHFLEHMLVAGSEKFPSKELLAEYIENVGGQFSLLTNVDYIMVDVEVPETEDIPIAIAVLNEIINKPVFNAKTFENERGSILAEYTAKKANQKDFLWQVCRRLFFQRTSVAQSTLGDPDSIRSISIDDIIEFKKKYFVGNNFTVLASGDVDMETLAQACSSLIPPSRDKGWFVGADSLLPIIREKSIDLETYPSQQVSVVVGSRTKSFNLHDEVCGDICATYLAEGRASLLAKKLRYEKGLVYGVSAFNRIYDGCGMFVIRTDCEAEKISDVMTVLGGTYKDFLKNGVPLEKLAFVISKKLKSFTVKLQTSRAWVEYNNSLARLSHKASVIDYMTCLEKITGEDIIKYVQDNLRDKPLYVAACGSKSTRKILAKSI